MLRRYVSRSVIVSSSSSSSLLTSSSSSAAAHMVWFTPTSCARRHRSSDRHDEIEVFDAQKAAPQKRGYTVHTLQEYVDNEDHGLPSKKKVTETISETADNPMWMIWVLGFLGVTVAFTIVSHRLRTEQRRFDPRMRQVKTIDQPGGPKIGGPFELTDTKGNRVKNTDFLGKWMFIYFGFVNCPDVCPAEMDKLTRVISQMDKKLGKDKWQPLFITVDPKRDTPEVLAEYLSDFHPRIIGLTGTQEEIERVARNYRVYFAVPDESNPNDYLVDHSIIMYLMSPEGKFVDYTTKDFNHSEVLGKLMRRIMDYDKNMAEAESLGIASSSSTVSKQMTSSTS
eukprot:PhM_4_TR8273/c3_g2_i1/m.53432/K07152/SCO1_2; protein SCO1/2